METNLIRELNSVLKLFPEFWQGETLLRSKVIDALKAKEPKLIKALIEKPKIRKIYSTDIDGVLIFDFDKLIGLLRFKEYWPDSFTKYRNKIGLTSAGKYLDYNSDVVLDFPFKDCVLEGGMTKEEQGKNEVYYNEIIARDEIDRLFSPKVFTNSKRYTKDGVEENIAEFKDDDNLIIKGNNLIALHSLKKRFGGKVNLVYMDPPYNTDNGSFKYNDRFNRSTWLTFMKNRLEVAKELLSDDGLIFISLDDNENHYCKVLADYIFHEDNFIADICHKSRASVSNDKIISLSHNHLLMYAKNERLIFENKAQYGIQNDLTGFNETDELGAFKYVPVDGPGGAKKGNPYYEFLGVRGYWRFSKEKMQQMYEAGKVVKRNNSLSQKYYISDAIKKKKTITTWWDDNFLTSSATKDLNELLGENSFNNPKNENLIKRIIEFATKETDLVLDCFLGSGTTAAVAHKMGRRYIGIEQMDYIKDITVPRLQKVVDGEQGGISKDVAWQGGGSFVYTELKQLNAAFIEAIDAASGYEELAVLFEKMKATAHLNYQVELDSVLTAEYEVDGIDHKIGFKDLSLDEQKRLLMELLDKNQLYVNVSEIDDATLDISENDKTFTKSFYGEVL